MYIAVGMQKAQDVKEVWLDGKKVDHVVELNTTEGWLIRLVTVENGNFIIEGEERETLTGEVKVIFW